MDYILLWEMPLNVGLEPWKTCNIMKKNTRLPRDLIHVICVDRSSKARSTSNATKESLTLPLLLRWTKKTQKIGEAITPLLNSLHDIYINCPQGDLTGCRTGNGDKLSNS